MRIFEESEAPVQSADEQSRERPDLIRLSVNLNRPTAEALREFADSRGISFTESVRRVISISSYLDGEMKSGKSVQVIDHRRREAQALILF